MVHRFFHRVGWYITLLFERCESSSSLLLPSSTFWIGGGCVGLFLLVNLRRWPLDALSGVALTTKAEATAAAAAATTKKGNNNTRTDKENSIMDRLWCLICIKYVDWSVFLLVCSLIYVPKSDWFVWSCIRFVLWDNWDVYYRTLCFAKRSF